MLAGAWLALWFSSPALWLVRAETYFLISWTCLSCFSCKRALSVNNRARSHTTCLRPMLISALVNGSRLAPIQDFSTELARSSDWPVRQSYCYGTSRDYHQHSRSVIVKQYIIPDPVTQFYGNWHCGNIKSDSWELRDTIQRIYIKAHSFNRQANEKQGIRLQRKYIMGLFYHSNRAGASICYGLPVKTVRFNVNSLYCIPQFPYRFSYRI